MTFFNKFSLDLGLGQPIRLDGKPSFSTVGSCPYCQYSSQDLRKHFEEVNNHGFARICPVCMKGYINLHSFQRHWDMYHNQTMNTKHKCEVCGKANQSKSHLVRHMKRHSELRYFTCPICSEGFKHKSNLKDHVARCSRRQK